MTIFYKITKTKEVELKDNELVARTDSYGIYRDRETGKLYIQTTNYQSGILIIPKDCLEYLALSERNK